MTCLRGIVLALLLGGAVAGGASERPGDGCAPVVPGTMATVPGDWAYVVFPDQLDGRAYYRLDDKATCKSNTPGHTVIKTWANKITVQGERLLLWGSLCNDTPTVVPLREASAALLLSRDLHMLRYKGECLTYADKPPTLCPQGLWCPVPAQE